VRLAHAWGSWVQQVRAERRTDERTNSNSNATRRGISVELK
jgi:hypothetical protein